MRIMGEGEESKYDVLMIGTEGIAGWVLGKLIPHLEELCGIF
jgi:hypothetical protein